jgi:hypothetical protein
VWRIRYNEELYEMYKAIPLSAYIQINILKWAGNVTRTAFQRRF